MMKIKNVLLLLAISFFVLSCSKDAIEEQKLDDPNNRIAQDQFDNSYLGVYKGLFSTNDGLTRGKVVVTLLNSNEGIAQIYLSSGEIIELKSSKLKLTLDNTVTGLRFSSEGISNIAATLEFSVEGNGTNPNISNVNFDNKASDILIAKNLSRAPLTTITGTYMRTSGTGGFPTSARTWNVMSIGSGNQTYAAQIFYGNRIYNTPPTGTQNGCTNSGLYETCDISGTARILGYDVNWSGTHTYSVSTAANEACSAISGTWAAPAYGNSSGTFISDSDCSGPLVDNDSCATATSVGVGSYTGSTNNATNTDTPSTCTGGLAGSASGVGVWYTYTATSDTGVTVDTEGTVGFDTQLRVFSGSCDALVCVGANDDGGSGLLSTVTFYATTGNTYYFFLGGYNTAKGDYTFNVQEVVILPPPANDTCAGATAIACGGTVSGSTANATSSDAPAYCDTTVNSGPGVWHSFSVTEAQNVTMDTAGSDFDTKLAVLSGSCGVLTCVAGNDDGTGISPRSRVTFLAVPGITYYAYVTGYSTNNGNYVLNATCVVAPPTPANNLCADATPVDCGGSVTGTTVGSSTTGVPTATCGTSLNTIGGVWHTFEVSTIQDVIMDTAGSDFDTKLGIFSGSCGTLTCVGGNDQGAGLGNQSLVAFRAVPGTTYYAYVTGYSTAVGNYVLNASCVTPPPAPANDLCVNAIAVACGASATGTNVGATSTGAPAGTCGTSFSSNVTGGVWYSFSTPTADTVTVNTIGTDFDTKLGVFTGSCGTLTCVGGNDDGGAGISPQSQVIFNAEANTTYYFYVAGYLGGTINGIGNINLNVNCVPPPPPLTCGETLVDNGGLTGNYANSSNDVYTLDAGAGNVISLNFSVFNTEATWDSMRLFNGEVVGVNEITNVNGRVIYNNTNANRTGFTGTGTGANSLQGQTVVSSGRYMKITFKSDGSGQREGFVAAITCIPARTADYSQIMTSATFMPAVSVSADNKVTPEAKKLNLEIEKATAAKQREIEGNRHLIDVENKKPEDKTGGKVFYNDADRIEYNRKHKL